MPAGHMRNMPTSACQLGCNPEVPDTLFSLKTFDEVTGNWTACHRGFMRRFFSSVSLSAISWYKCTYWQSGIEKYLLADPRSVYLYFGWMS